MTRNVGPAGPGGGERWSGAPAPAGTLRPIAVTAIVVPMRNAAADCIERLAGRRVGDRPSLHPLTSTAMQTVIQSQEHQASRSAPRDSHTVIWWAPNGS
jgi:hypothetical protein